MSVLVVMGIALALFGAIVLLLLPNRPGGEISFRNAKVSSPTAGMLLIVLGLVAVALEYGVGGDDGTHEQAKDTSPATQPAPDAPTTSATMTRVTTTATVPVSGCVIRVNHIGARISEQPRHDARELASVPSGQYQTLDFTTSNWAGRVEGWFFIKVNSRQGWIVDNSMFITEKSAACA